MKHLLKYAVEMSSGMIIYISSFTKIGLDIQKLVRDSQTHSHLGDRSCILSYFRKKELGYETPARMVGASVRFGTSFLLE
jgi:hypothetical protein